jgi:hypothetical protein
MLERFFGFLVLKLVLKIHFQALSATAIKVLSAVADSV